MKIVVIYHRADFDGLFCREIARKMFGDSAEYIGWDYGDPVPVIGPDVRLYMLDISIPELMDYPYLVWIDHHASAIEKYDKLIGGWRIDGVAACRLAWQYFFESGAGLGLEKKHFVDRYVVEPEAVRLAGEYDVFDERDLDAQKFQLGLKIISPDQIRWDDLFDDPNHRYLNSIVTHGGIIYRYKTEQDAKTILNSGHDIEWSGLKFLAINTAKGYNSHLFNAGVRPDHDALMGYGYDGKKWTVSLYGVKHRTDLDLSKIAVKMGGGGHHQACGFTVETLPWIPPSSRQVLDAFMGVAGQELRFNVSGKPNGESLFVSVQGGREDNRKFVTAGMASFHDDAQFARDVNRMVNDWVSEYGSDAV